MLSRRRPFGLNFERHIPETVQLPNRRVRRGDRVVFRAPRGESEKDLDPRTWIVTGFEGAGDDRQATLMLPEPSEEPVTTTRKLADLVVVAEFRDPIYPGLRPSGTVESGGERPYHVVINGENYHVLEALTFTWPDARLAPRFAVTPRRSPPTTGVGERSTGVPPPPTATRPVCAAVPGSQRGMLYCPPCPAAVLRGKRRRKRWRAELQRPAASKGRPPVNSGGW